MSPHLQRCQEKIFRSSLLSISDSEQCLGIQLKFCFLTCFQAYVHKSVMEELKRIIDDSEITKEDDALWPPPDRVGRQVSGLATLLYCRHLTNEMRFTTVHMTPNPPVCLCVCVMEPYTK